MFSFTARQTARLLGRNLSQRSSGVLRGSLRGYSTTPAAASLFSRRSLFSYQAVGAAAVFGAALTYKIATDIQEPVFAAGVVPPEGLPGTNQERSFIAIKPDGVQRGLVAEIIRRFEAKGYRLVAMKMVRPTKEKAAGHYADLSSKPFFPSLVDYFSSGPIVAMVWEGHNAIKGGRKLIGATNPDASEPGSIRGDLCVLIGRNIIHGSDGPDSAKHEINFWFDAEEIAQWERDQDKWVYD